MILNEVILKKWDTEKMNTYEYSFENFIVDNSNRFAFTAALNVADGLPKKVYNPLLIYGDDQCALGKNHLVCAIRNSIAKFFRILN